MNYISLNIYIHVAEPKQQIIPIDISYWQFNRRYEHRTIMLLMTPECSGFLFAAIWTAPCENVSSAICRRRRPRSACASAQSDQDLHCPLTESLDTTKYMNGEQKPGWYFAHAQVDQNLRILCSFEGIFSLDAVHILLCATNIGIQSVRILWDDNYEMEPDSAREKVTL